MTRDERQQAVEKHRREQELNDIRYILKSEEGRRFIWRLLNLTGFYKSEFFGNSRDFFDKGKRAIGTSLHADVMEADGFKSFEKMYKEFLKGVEEEKSFVENGED